MNARDRRAATLALAGGTLGLAAGGAQAMAGHRLGAWAGSKADPVLLGVLTIILAAAALSAGLVIARCTAGISVGRRAALTAALALPAAVGFSTAGRLWWLPGTLLLVAAVLVASVAPAAAARAAETEWLSVLTATLGASMALTAAAASPPLLAIGLASGLAVAAAPWIAPRWAAVATLVLLAGSLPFAALTWWSAITPLTAVIAVPIGLAAIRGRVRRAGACAPAAAAR